MRYRGDPFARARRAESDIYTNREQNKAIEAFNESLQGVADKQGWWGSSLLSGLAGVGGKLGGAKLAGMAGLSGGLLPMLLAGMAVYATTKGLKSGKWKNPLAKGDVSSALKKAKKASKGRFSEAGDFGTYLTGLKSNIEKSAGTQALIDSVITMATMGAGDAIKGLGKTGTGASKLSTAVGKGVDKFGNPVGEILGGVGKSMITSPLKSSTYSATGIGKNLLGQLLQNPNFQTFAAPAMAKPAMAYTALQNIGKPRPASMYDYSNLNIGGY